jgi:hypothetical protein
MPSCTIIPELVYERPGEVTHSLRVRVENADQHHERASVRRAHPASADRLPVRRTAIRGQRSRRPPLAFSQTIADVAPDDWGGTSTPIE